MLERLLTRARQWFSGGNREARVDEAMHRLKEKTPIPVFWLFGKTQSGKTSVVKYLTGAERAEIGRGFQPCTRFSSRYAFPTEETPVLTFLDTRGLDEPGYDAAEDLARFNTEAHVVLVVVRALDHAQENVRENLRKLREASPRRPVVLVLTTLHEAYPQQQHTLPYPFGPNATLTDPPEPLHNLARSIEEQKRAFQGLVDRVVALDLTPAEEGFNEPNYGGQVLRDTLLEVLPGAFGQTLRTLDAAQHDLRDVYMRQAMPIIVSHSTMAATAGAVPLPFVDLLVVSGVQTRMVTELAELYGQPMTRERLAEIAGTLGLGLLTRQASRTLIKVVPGLGSILGSVAGGALAGASTYALGKAFCYYYRVVLEGHIPDPEKLKQYYREQMGFAEKLWSGEKKA